MNIMSFKGYKAQVMEAGRLTGECMHGLPPGRALDVYHSDEFVQWPENWMKGSFVVPVKPNTGLWFNWVMNDCANTAVLPTVKGCNPLTGMQTSGFHLERYVTKCPKHGCDFKGDRYCPECDYKWPFENYVAYPNTLWLDGWLNPKDGTVRQFFFTEEELRDVATHMIGKENTVPAFGFAFYKPKERRVTKQPLYRGPGVYEIKGTYFGSSSSLSKLWDEGSSFNSTLTYNNASYTCDSVNVKTSTGSTKGFSKGATRRKQNIMILGDSDGALSCLEEKTSGGIICSNSDTQKRVTIGGPISAMNYHEDMDSEPVAMAACASSYDCDNVGEIECLESVEEQPVIRERLRSYKESKRATKEVSVGAGAKIAQDLAPDPYPIDSWCDSPDSVMTIYFVFQEKFEEMKAAGMKNLEGKAEGMLAGVPVG